MPEPIFNVRDYGAHGDGNQLDDTPIQHALQDCDTAGGGTVYFPPGNYRVQSTVLLSSRTILRGANKGFASGAVLLVDTSKTPTGIRGRTENGQVRDLQIVDLTIDGFDTTMPAGTRGIDFTDVSNSTIERVSIRWFERAVYGAGGCHRRLLQRGHELRTRLPGRRVARRVCQQLEDLRRTHLRLQRLPGPAQHRLPRHHHVPQPGNGRVRDADHPERPLLPGGPAGYDGPDRADLANHHRSQGDRRHRPLGLPERAVRRRLGAASRWRRRDHRRAYGRLRQHLRVHRVRAQQHRRVRCQGLVVLLRRLPLRVQQPGGRGLRVRDVRGLAGPGSLYNTVVGCGHSDGPDPAHPVGDAVLDFDGRNVSIGPGAFGSLSGIGGGGNLVVAKGVGTYVDPSTAVAGQPGTGLPQPWRVPSPNMGGTIASVDNTHVPYPGARSVKFAVAATGFSLRDFVIPLKVAPGAWYVATAWVYTDTAGAFAVRLQDAADKPGNLYSNSVLRPVVGQVIRTIVRSATGDLLFVLHQLADSTKRPIPGNIWLSDIKVEPGVVPTAAVDDGLPERSASFGGPQTASGANARIKVDRYIHHVDGDGSIQIIDSPAGFGGVCVLVADGRWTTNPTGGNVANYVAPTPGQAVLAAYDPITSRWYFQIAHQKAQGSVISLDGSSNQRITVDHPVHEIEGTGSIQTIVAPADMSELTLIPRVGGATTVAWTSGSPGNIRSSTTLVAWRLVRLIKNASDGQWCLQ